MEQLLTFLQDLKENNNRDWFEANRKRYSEARRVHEALLEQVTEGISRFDPVTGRPAVKDCIFRINRDVRFSKDKSPYKTHFGAFIARDGRKSIRPGYYVHLEPGNCFMGGGVYMPEPSNLKKIRNEIYFNAPAFRNILHEPAFSKVFTALYEDKLSRPPKDYDPAFADIELLKYKSYFVEKDFTEEEVLSPAFAGKIVEYCRIILPMNMFLNKALED